MLEQQQNDYLRGLSYNGYEIFGAHPSIEYDQHGVRFTVYAPNAYSVYLIGECNEWQGFEMHRQDNGIWTIFVKEAAPGQMYKYRIVSPDGSINDRIDPFAFSSEKRPSTASIIYELDGFNWSDYSWMCSRNKNHDRPMSIYELHVGSWRWKNGFSNSQSTSTPLDPFLTYSELSEELIPYVKQMGYTHIELLPLTEHPFDGSWGYQVAGYFSPTSRYGSPKELMQFVNQCHNAGIGVIMDFVPLHFVKDFYALHQFDSGFLYENSSPNVYNSQWGTALFDYTKPHVISFLRSSLNFWLGVYHFDGIRYDAVSNLIYPNGNESAGLNEPGLWFLRSTNETLQQLHPSAMLIAEDSSSYLKVTAPVVYGGLGFDYKWNLGWMHDTLDYLATPPQSRPSMRDKMMFSISYFYNDVFLLPFSHDEVVHGKLSIIGRLYGNYTEKFAQLKLLYLYMFSHPGKKLNFMGNDLAEFKEWDESKELAWSLLDHTQHRSFQEFFESLQKLYLKLDPLFSQDYHMDSFHWLNAHSNSPCTFAFSRDGLSGDCVYVVLHFGDYPCNYIIPVKEPGCYIPLIKTNDIMFADDNKIQSRYQGGDYQLQLSLPPYSGVIIQKYPEI